MADDTEKKPPDPSDAARPHGAPIRVDQGIDRIASEALKEARRREALEKAKADARTPPATPIRSGPPK